MLIKSLTLYKTNLDPYYKNVYDDYTSIDTYLQFLNQTFQKIDISISNPKSSMDNNGNFRICVSGYNSMELHHFNYIAFDNYLQSEESDYKFAFILSVESQNDGQTSSCILNCRLDAWTENYLSIKANSSSNIFVANRCTFDSYNSKYLYLFSSRYMPNIYYTVKNDFVSEALIDRTNNVPSSLQNIRILWERIRVDPAQHFYDTTTTTHYNLGSSDTMLCGAYRCEAGWLIRPIAVFVGNEPFNKSGSYYITARVYENGHEHTDYHILSNTIPVRPSDLFGVYVYNSEYTFFPPFRYELDLQLTEGDEFRFIIKPLSTAHHLIRYKCGTDDASSIITAFGIPEIGDFGSNSTGRIDISLTRYKPTFTKTVTRFSSIYDDILANDEMFYRYPFARTAIMWNDKQVILSGNSSTDHIRLYVDLYSSIHPSVWITNDTLKRMAIKDVVRNTGSVYSMSTSLDSYLT